MSLKIDYQRVKEMREFFGLTQEELGEEIGMRQKSISHFETGRTKNIPKPYLSYMLSRNISLDWLMGWTDIMFISDKKEISEDEMQGFLENSQKIASKNEHENTADFLKIKDEKIEELQNHIQDLKADKEELYNLLQNAIKKG